MSMISARCDELRAMSESVGLAMPQAATLMMEAADTIWELRCKLAGMVDMRERARLAEVENAKLRELVARLIACVDTISNSDTFYYQPRRDGCGIDCTANGEHCSLVKMCDQARELGIEVD